jgi:dUTP pyrophosphatase
MTLHNHALLYIAITNSDEELVNKYKNLASEHNKQVCEDPYPNAGVDLFFPKETILSTLDSSFVSMDIKCEMRLYNKDIQDWTPTGYYLYPRSSMSKTPLMLANQTGIIDSGYRGNIIGAFRNISSNPQPFTVEKHTRLLQICAPDLRPIMIEIVSEEFFEKTSRNNGGFGSTGK